MIDTLSFQQVLLTLVDFDIGYARKTPKLDKCSSSAQQTVDKVTLELGDDKLIAMCGSIDTGRDYHEGQHFMSYSNRITIQLTTQEREFGSEYQPRRGFKMKFAFIAREGTLTTTLELIRRANNQKAAFGTITSLNYPHLAPTYVANVIYLKSQVGYSIELSPSKLLYSYIGEGECSADQETMLSITDHYGNISLFPPTTRTWSICRKSSDTVFKPEVRIRKSASDALHYATNSNRFRSIVSTFHVLALRTTSLSSSVPTHHFMPIFQFKFKTYKGTCLNKSFVQQPENR